MKPQLGRDLIKVAIFPSSRDRGRNMGAVNLPVLEPGFVRPYELLLICRNHTLLPVIISRLLTH